jgi:long-chain acyl-CoA synthetase
LLRTALERFQKRDTFLIRNNGRWEPVAMTTVLARVDAIRAALASRGVVFGDRVAILSESRLEWALADMAILTLGAVTVPIYPTLPANQVAPLLADAGCVAAFVSNRDQKIKIETGRAVTPALRWIWCLDEEPLPGLGAGSAGGGATATPETTIASDTLASIIYTSGTTGTPKGVMLTHGNLAAQACLSLQAMSITNHDSYLSFLPLSHVFERCSGLYTMILGGATVAYAESPDRMAVNLTEVRPTILLAVPRFYEKLLEKAVQVSEAMGFPRANLSRWGRSVAMKWAELRDSRQPVPPSLGLQHALAGFLVYDRLKSRLGGRLRLRVSGGAALHRDTALFFYGAGMPNFEGYGLTETASAISVNRFESYRIGTVGPVFDGLQVKIASDGEVLVRGPVVMKGYWNRPKETAEALVDGWFHTGDIGIVDPDGHLRITDRKKDLIATSGGKKVAPQVIEDALKSSPKIQEAIVLGEGHKFIAALIVPANGATHDEVAAEVDRVNAGLAQFERVKRFELIPDNLSVENGALTPSLKVKRRVVADRHQDLIARLFAGA